MLKWILYLDLLQVVLTTIGNYFSWIYIVVFSFDILYYINEMEIVFACQPYTTGKLIVKKGNYGNQD